MRKILQVYLLSFCFSAPLYSQEFETEKIKVLKRSVSRLSGIPKVDGMISLCQEYFGFGFFGPGDPRIDSLQRYGMKAREEAAILKYTKGEAHANVFLALVDMSRLSRKSNEAAEKLLNQSLATNRMSEDMRGYSNSFLGAIYTDAYSDHEKSSVYFKQALQHFQDCGNIEEEAITYYRLAETYRRKTDLVNAVDYCGKALRLSGYIIKTNNKKGWADYMYLQPLNLMQTLYRLGGDYASAKQIQELIDQYFAKNYQTAPSRYPLATIYLEEGRYDSAIYYFKIEYANNPANPGTSSDLGKAFLGSKDYVTALKYLQLAIDTFRSRVSMPNRPNAKPNLVRTLIVAAKANYLMQNYDNAARIASEGLTFLNTIRNRFSRIEEYELLADAYQFTSKSDSALVYFKKYTVLKDSMVSKQFLFQLANVKRQTEDERKEIMITLLKKDNQLKQEQLAQELLIKEQKETELVLLDKENKLKKQQLKHEELARAEKDSQLGLLSKENSLKVQELKQQAFVRYALLGSIGAIMLISIFVFRLLALKRKNEIMKREKAEHELRMNQLENEKKQAALQQQAVELEIQALRAQINPHFIFNCLSSINLLILENNNDAASDYLTRFSKLIRMILTSSEKTTVTLQDELMMLELYLKMEQLRFSNSFEYNIKISKDLEPDSVIVPPLLLQPVCENAIWHGLNLRKEKGRLDININIHENGQSLRFVITDNGSGRKIPNVTEDGDHKPMGIKLTRERVALFNGEKNGNNSYEIEDLIDENGQPAGTRVFIRLKNYEWNSEPVLSTSNESDHNR